MIKKKNTILITGATGLLGAEFVKNFGAQGHSIIFTSRNQKKINVLSKKLNNLGADKVDYIECLNLKKLEFCKNTNNNFNIFLAYYLNDVRLIDNL